MPGMAGMSSLTFSRFFVYDVLGVAGYVAMYVAIGVLAGWNPLATGVAFAVVVAFGIARVARRGTLGEDAVIGVFFSAAMALGLVLFSLQRGYQQDLFGYLFGNVLAIGGAELAMLTAVGALILAVLALLFRKLLFVAFDAEVDKGSEAARYWLHVLSNARRWRPYWEDVNRMLQDGADVRRWIAAGVGLSTSFRFPDYAGLLECLDRARAGQELAAPLVERFEAVMDEALAVLGEATGCPDEEADRLLAEWDRLNAGYSEVVDLAGLEEARREDLSLEVKV